MDELVISLPTVPCENAGSLESQDMKNVNNLKLAEEDGWEGPRSKRGTEKEEKHLKTV